MSVCYFLFHPNSGTSQTQNDSVFLFKVTTSYMSRFQP